MTTLMQANRQWATRPHDQRFTSLSELAAHVSTMRANSQQAVVPARKIGFAPTPDNAGLLINVPQADIAVPTHWSFGQVARLAGAGMATDYLRTKLPAPIVADCLNYSLRFGNEAEDIGVMLTKATPENGLEPATELRAATGPQYGRIWNDEVAAALVHRFGYGISGDWRVPGEFGKAVTVTQDNTTLYASDRDLFVFLADEKNRIEVPNRRAGETGSLARGFFVWNSEVGSASLGAGFFLFDYVCCNRIVWGARDYTEIRIRHTSGAPDRWLEEVEPVLTEYANGSASPVVAVIEDAQRKRIDDLDRFLGERFGRKMVTDLKGIHEIEEHRPIETLWDATNAVTAYARGIAFQDRRVELEREAGKILQLAA